MHEYTDNDGNPLSDRFYIDVECPKKIFDATLDSSDRGLEVFGWWPDGDASAYAQEIVDMLNRGR